MKKLLLFICSLTWFSYSVNAQLKVSRSAPYNSVNYLVNKVLLANGIVASNITYTGGDTAVGFFNGMASNLGLDSGIILTTGTITNAPGPNNTPGASYSGPNCLSYTDPDLATIASTNVDDAAIIQFDFIANSDTLSFKYVFGSEEYPEFVNSFNDAFGFFVSGPGILGPYTNNAENIAVLPSGTPVTINNVNCNVNSNFYVCNWPSSPCGPPCPTSANMPSTTVQYDGFTVVLTAKAALQCGQKYHIKIAIADAGDCAYDSGVFLKGMSFNYKDSVTTTSVKCNGGTGSAKVTVTGGSPPYTYAWSPSGGSGANATGLSVGTYTVTITGGGGCSLIDSAVITQPAAITQKISLSPCGNPSAADTVKGGTPGYTYLWSSGQTTSNVTGLTMGTYTITVKDANGCTNTTSLNVSVSNAETVTVTGTTDVLCSGGNSGSITTNTAGGASPYTYNWTPSGGTNANASNLSAGSYTLTVTDANGCIVTASAIITQPTALILTAPGPQAICAGDSVNLITNVTGGSGPYTYNWIPAAGLSCTNCASPMASPAATGTYTVIVTDACGADSASVPIAVTPSPTVSFAADTLNGCAPVCTNFTDMSTMTGGTIVWWNWNFGDGSTDTLQNTHHCYTKPGKYTVTLSVTSNNGCKSKLAIPAMITVYNFPLAAFTFKPQPTTILQPTITFGDESKDSYGIASWLWTFGGEDNATSTLENPVYKYQDTGTYCATLRVTNIHGCVDSVTECLIISPQFTLYIPDAFSPNGDGLNDIFTPKGEYVYNFKMYIFDRWGMLLYHTTDINKGWNGAVNGDSKLCQEDTYVYLITCQDNFGTQHSYIGRVTLSGR